MQTNSHTSRPLENITVLDITTALAGPFATLMLAGLGARVIKVESPLAPDTCRTNAPFVAVDGLHLAKTDADAMSVSALNRLRNKQCITLNLKHPQSALILADLVRRSDVLVENFSVGVLEKLGAGYESMSVINPRLVYCSITGFGRSAAGPGKAMDTIIQALSGLMLTSGLPQDPPMRIGVPLADLITPLFGVIGILSALHQREQTGKGQCVDVSMLGAMTSLVAAEHLDVLAQLGVPMRTGQTAARLAPFGVYRALDGYVAICAPFDGLAEKLFAAMGQQALLQDERFNTRDKRVENRAALDQMVESWTSTKNIAELLPLLESANVPVAEVRDPAAAVTDSHVLARGETVPLAHPKFGVIEGLYGTGMPIKFSDAQAGFDRAAPMVGEHNELIYQTWLGYSAETVANLKRDGVI